MKETEKIRERYARRRQLHDTDRYNPLNTAVYMGMQEKERALIRCLSENDLGPVHDLRVLEIGCGSGGNLLHLLQLGFQPKNLVGNELLEDRVVIARHRLPAAVQVLAGDAASLPCEIGLFDIVYQSTVFTSILDDSFQQKLANHIWSLVRPGGAILWYDFVYNNPSNPDVRGVPLSRIRQLFPAGKLKFWRITLAPPISRRVTKIHPSLYSFFNVFPFLRTHLLCWIKKDVG